MVKYNESKQTKLYQLICLIILYYLFKNIPWFQATLDRTTLLTKYIILDIFSYLCRSIFKLKCQIIQFKLQKRQNCRSCSHEHNSHFPRNQVKECFEKLRYLDIIRIPFNQRVVQIFKISQSELLTTIGDIDFKEKFKARFLREIQSTAINYKLNRWINLYIHKILVE